MPGGGDMERRGLFLGLPVSGDLDPDGGERLAPPLLSLSGRPRGLEVEDLGGGGDWRGPEGSGMAG